jgi:hypothetical protein
MDHKPGRNSGGDIAMIPLTDHHLICHYYISQTTEIYDNLCLLFSVGALSAKMCKPLGHCGAGADCIPSPRYHAISRVIIFTSGSKPKHVTPRVPIWMGKQWWTIQYWV